MLKKRLVVGLLVCVTAAACANSREPANMNSGFTSSVLDRYAPGLRFGQPITRANGSRPGEKSIGSQKLSDVKPLPVPKDGFTHVRVSGDPFVPPRSRAATTTHRITFFPLGSSSPFPESRNLVAVINRMSDRPARQGCALGDLVRIRDMAFVWDQPGGGGAVLLLPPSTEGRSSKQVRVPRLIVFPRGKRAKDVVQGLTMHPCGAADAPPPGDS
jgi:hypothetical protein